MESKLRTHLYTFSHIRDGKDGKVVSIAQALDGPMCVPRVMKSRAATDDQQRVRYDRPQAGAAAHRPWDGRLQSTSYGHMGTCEGVSNGSASETQTETGCFRRG